MVWPLFRGLVKKFSSTLCHIFRGLIFFLIPFILKHTYMQSTTCYILFFSVARYTHTCLILLLVVYLNRIWMALSCSCWSIATSAWVLILFVKVQSNSVEHLSVLLLLVVHLNEIGRRYRVRADQLLYILCLRLHCNFVVFILILVCKDTQWSPHKPFLQPELLTLGSDRIPLLSFLVFQVLSLFKFIASSFTTLYWT